MPEQEPLRRWSLQDALLAQQRRSGDSLTSATGGSGAKPSGIGKTVDAASEVVSEITKFVSPATIIQAVREGFHAFRGYRMLAFGAQSVGKSTLWNYLETGQAGAQVEKTHSPSGVGGSSEDPLFRLRTIRGAGIVRVGIRAYDVPGDPQYRQVWPQVLKMARPEILIFMIDHDAGDQEVPGEGYTTSRMDAHAQAFADLQSALFADPELAGEIKAMMVLANKYDIWHGKLQYGTLLHRANVYTMMSDLSTVIQRASIRYGYCSARTGDNVTELMKTILKELS